MQQNKITIIVPIYGVAKYLPGCLDSICAQTNPNFRAILVDDGSTDGCAQICDAYAQKDSRFSVIHQKNGGRSAARNAGMDACQTEWLWFVDGDDTIQQDAIEKLMGALNDHSDVIFFSGVGPYHGGVRPIETQEVAALTEFMLTDHPKPAQQYPIIHRLKRNYVILRLFRTEFLRKHSIRFQTQLTIAEDLLFMLEAMQKMQRPLYIDEQLYHYNQNEQSVTRKYNQKACQYETQACLAVREFVEKYYPKRMDLYYQFVLNSVKRTIRMDFASPENPCSLKDRNLAFRAFLKEKFIQEALHQYNRAYAGSKLRIFVLLLKIGDLRPILRMFPHINQFSA